MRTGKCLLLVTNTPIHSMKTREERGLYALSLPSRSLPPPCLNSPGCVEYRPVIAVRPHQDRKDVRYMYVRLCVYVCVRKCVVFCIGYRTLLARCESTHIQLSCNRVNNTPYPVCVCECEERGARFTASVFRTCIFAIGCSLHTRRSVLCSML